MRALRLAVITACAVGFMTLATSAAADHATRPAENLRALGHSPFSATFFGVPAIERKVNSDLAFWEDLVFQGNYDGFRILRANPYNPREISHPSCVGDQGDIVVWEDILLRSYNSPAPAGVTCDGEPIPEGFEGFHVWDISDVEDPDLIGSVELSARPQADAFGCGSHTATLVPDLEEDRLLVYNQTSGGPCPFVGVVEVPLDAPEDARWLKNIPLAHLGPAHAAHDSGVILGDVNLLAVASHTMAHVFDIGDNDTPGGSLTDPVLLYTIEEPGVCNEPNNPLCNGNWHSASFTWDGEVIILGWEPGGGALPECEATDPPVKKSAFFYKATTGEKLGQWTLPRPQSAAENCTIHNYNTVPTKDGRYILVSGNYQAGTWVTEFTDPSHPVTLGYADPPPLPNVLNVSGPMATRGQMVPELGGAWSTYWYNGYLWESEITKGLNVFKYTGRDKFKPKERDRIKAIKVDHLNPQTQEFSLPPVDKHSPNMKLLANLPKVDDQAQSDLAFQGRYAYAGTFSGLRVIDISRPWRPEQVSFTRCPGGQFDVSVWGDLLFASVDSPMTDDSCNAQNAPNAATPGAWEGVRIFDISDPRAPRLIKSIATDCGSHTHTLVPTGKKFKKQGKFKFKKFKKKGKLFIYVSSYAVTTTSVGPNCQQFHGKISVIEVDLKRPWRSDVVAEPRVNVPDFESDRLEIPSATLQDTNGCHDITVLVPKKLAAAACLSVGQLWDISRPLAPRAIRTLTTPQVKAWHSSAFTWDGRRVAFGDEAGGGVLGRCRAEDYPDTGAIWIYDVRTGAELGNYKIPRFFPASDHCTMHNYNFVPGIDRDILVSAAYHGGTTVADVTDPANPVEIAWYEAMNPHASTWSSYWHNGFVYANDINRGFDVFFVKHPALRGAARLFRDNPQTQERLFK
jgi:hypothetical protein